MTIVPATVSDAEEISSLVNAAYRGEGGRAGWTHETALVGGLRTTPGVLREMIAAGQQTILLARAPGTGRLAGCVCIEPLHGVTWLLSMLAVDPQQQTSGLGRKLMSEAESYLRAHGAAIVQITVIQLRESLIAWYERRGYRRTGETESFPYGDDSVGVPLRTDLYFVVLEKRLDPLG